ncbi:MAG: hypothetical protein R3E87_22070 [Burkholderiaceae bacterium]
MTADTQGGLIYFSITLAILLSGVTWAFVVVRIGARKRFDLVDIFLLAFGAVYGVAYAFVIYMTMYEGNVVGFRIIGHEQNFWLIPMVAAFGAIAAAAVSTLSGEVKTPPAPVATNAVALRKAIFLVAVLFLGVALLATWLYTRAYGGIAGFLAVASALRAGLFDEAGANPLSFLKPFCGFSIFSSYCFAAVFLDRGQSRDGMFTMAILGFIVSAAISSFTLLGWGGRVDLLAYWASLVFGFLVYRTGLTPRLLLRLTLVMLALIMALPPLTNAMNPGKNRGSFANFFAAELTFPVESSLNIIDFAGSRKGVDLVAAPIFILPERIWRPMGVEPISDINSELLLGDVPRQGFGYTIPVDITTFGLFQFGLVGPGIVIAIWCLFLIWIDRQLVFRLPRGFSAMLYAHSALFVAALSVLYFDPKMQITRNFHFIAGMLTLVALLTFRRQMLLMGRD